MRFPRFMKRRDDKSWEQASTSQQFADMYRRQIREAPARQVKAEAGAGGAEIIRQGSEDMKVEEEEDEVDEDEGEGDAEESGGDEGEREDED